MKKCMLIYDSEGAKKNASYIKMHFDYGNKLGIEFVLIIIDKAKKQTEDLFHNISSYPRYAIVRTINTELSLFLEKNGVTIFNNYEISKLANNKYLAIDFVKKNTDIPYLESKLFSYHELDEILGNSVYELDEKLKDENQKSGKNQKNANYELDEKLKNKNHEFVIKSLDGHGGNEVFLSSDSFDLISKKLTKKHFLIQPYLKNAKEDVRVFVVFNKIYACVKRRAVSDFKSNFSLGGEVSFYIPPQKLVSYVNQLFELLDFSFAGIDFLIDENGDYIFNEIEDVVGARMLYNTSKELDILYDFLVELQKRI